MIEIAEKVLIFLIVFIVTYILDYIIYYRKIKNKKINRSMMPTNIKYLIYKYKLDVVKIGVKEIYKKLMICDSFIISILFSITSFIENTYIRLFVAFLLVFPFFAGIYHLIAIYYIKESE